MRIDLAIGGALAVVAATAAVAGLLGSAGPASGFAVEIRHADGIDGGGRCPAVEMRRLGADGGCVLRARRAPASFTVLTLFGDHHLARCMVAYTLRVDGSGELAITGFSADDLPGHSSTIAGPSVACGDILPCRPEPANPAHIPNPGEVLPWAGKIVSDGAETLVEVDACFDTCLGRFEGGLTLRLEPRGQGRWRVVADRATLGDSDFEVSGGWGLEQRGGAGVSIRERP